MHGAPSIWRYGNASLPREERGCADSTPRRLPFGLDPGVAATNLYADRWSAGQALMKSTNPMGWATLAARLGDRDCEYFCIILLDTRHRFMELVELLRGTIDGASVHCRRSRRGFGSADRSVLGNLLGRRLNGIEESGAALGDLLVESVVTEVAQNVAARGRGDNAPHRLFLLFGGVVFAGEAFRLRTQARPEGFVDGLDLAGRQSLQE